MKKVFTIILLVILAVFIIGCTSIQNDSNSNSQNNNNNDNDDFNLPDYNLPNQLDLNQPTNDNNSLDLNIDPSKSKRDLIDLWGKNQANNNYRIDYNKKVFLYNNPPDSNLEESTNTVFRLDGNYRMDSNYPNQNQSQIIVLKNNAQTICLIDKNDLNIMECITVDDPTKPIKMDLLFADLSLIENEFVITKTKNQIIADENSSCFEFSNTTILQSLCYTTDGLLTMLKTQKQESKEIEMIATRIDRNVTQADFNFGGN